jgi:hypothetical protein
MTVRATGVQMAQVEQILASAVFSPEDRLRWTLEIGAMAPLEARFGIAQLAALYKERQRRAA